MKISKVALFVSLLSVSTLSQAKYQPDTGKCIQPIYKPHTNVTEYCSDFYHQRELDRSVKEGNKLYKSGKEEYGLSILKYAKENGHHFVHFDLYKKAKNSTEAKMYLEQAALHGHKDGINLQIKQLLLDQKPNEAFSYWLLAKRLGYKTDVKKHDFEAFLSHDKTFSLTPAATKQHQHNARKLFKKVKKNNILINEFGYMKKADQEKLKTLFLSPKSIENSLNIGETMEKYLDINYDNDLYVDHVLIMNEYYLRAALNESTYALNKLGDTYYRFGDVNSFYYDYNTRLKDYKSIDFYLMSMNKGDKGGFEGYVRAVLENNIGLREDTLEVLVQFLNGEYSNNTSSPFWDIGHFIAKSYHKLGNRDKAFKWAVISIGKGTKQYDHISRQVLDEIKNK